MPYYPIIIELIQKAKESLRGYCAGMTESSCEAKLREDIQEAMKDFGINMEPFFDYPLYALDGNETLVSHSERPTFEGEVSFELLQKNLNTTGVNPREVDEAMSTVTEGLITNNADGRWWPFGSIIGKFFPSEDPGKAGMLSYDTHYASLGILNYGYKFEGNTYVFKNDKQQYIESPDAGCEGTEDKKSASLYNGKFNCVYGQKYTTDEVNELQLFKIRNPGFRDEDLYFIEPEIGFATTHAKEDPLYKQAGKFFNPHLTKYGAPLNIREQNIKHDLSIINKLAQWSMEE